MASLGAPANQLSISFNRRSPLRGGHVSVKYPLQSLLAEKESLIALKIASREDYFQTSFRHILNRVRQLPRNSFEGV